MALSATPDHAPAEPQVVLGSGSRYRRELLGRILPEFEVVVPGADESPRPGEAAQDLALRLACRKAEVVANQRPAALVIGSDQVAECAGQILGKPGTAERAMAQLRTCAGQPLSLYTAVCARGPGGGPIRTHVDHTTLMFRELGDAEIRRYVQRDQPLDCAGSFRIEALGAALFSEVITRDPTAIQGLPLLWLSGALSELGVRII